VEGGRRETSRENEGGEQWRCGDGERCVEDEGVVERGREGDLLEANQRQ
jgi:hypothetical protein